MSTKCLPKNTRKPLKTQEFAGLVKYGVYQNVYYGHFSPPETLFPGDFLRFSSLLKGVSGASYAPNRLKVVEFQRFGAFGLSSHHLKRRKCT